MGKIISTLITVVVAVGFSAAIWVGANLVFNQARYHWARFNGLVFGVGGFLLGVLLSGNRLTIGSEGETLGGFLNWVWLPLALTAVFAVVGVALTRTDDDRQRLVIAVVTGAVVGVGLGLLIQDQYLPSFSPVGLIGWTVAGVAIGGGLALARKKPPLNGVLVWGALFFIIGAWGTADLGAGSTVEAVIGTLVPALALGVRLGLTDNPELHTRTIIDQKSRAVIFLGPALLFIFITLLVPTIRTIYLSLLDNRSEEFVAFENYVTTFQDRGSWDASGFSNFFTSQLFWIGVVLLGIGVVLGIVQKQRTGKAVELGGPSLGPLVVAGVLLAFALFTALRGTIVNNLWWVVAVTLFSTVLGLAVAVLADKAKGEKIAKSIIFMPMAISMVGASIIWRFMYATRDISGEQTGVLNALWVGLGRLSTGSGLPTLIVTIVLGLILLGLAYMIAMALTQQNVGRAVVPGVAFLLIGWFFVRFAGIVGGGVGGFRVTADGQTVARTIDFITDSPYNNFWLMVILIWIQTGFAMVILSAAIKAVPEEYIEAARVDGATQSQIFWRIVLPQIGTTIGVVVTTLIVVVMKVYDIVKVVTNGQFGTQVLANDMFNQAFAFGNTGRGAALAVLIFVSVLPVMYLNIRRMQKEA